jgi:hypothetical protein
MECYQGFQNNDAFASNVVEEYPTNYKPNQLMNQSTITSECTLFDGFDFVDLCARVVSREVMVKTRLGRPTDGVALFLLRVDTTDDAAHMSSLSRSLSLL